MHFLPFVSSASCDAFLFIGSVRWVAVRCAIFSCFWARLRNDPVQRVIVAAQKSYWIGKEEWQTGLDIQLTIAPKSIAK